MLTSSQAARWLPRDFVEARHQNTKPKDAESTFKPVNGTEWQ
jgi:hypothetical protein